MRMKIFVVIAVFNRKEYTMQCLQLLENQSFKDFSIVVVDDGSTDGTNEAIQNSYPDVMLVQGTGNWWWTKSMNKGCEEAIKHGAEVLITLNNDTLFDEKFIEKLVRLHHENPRSVLGCINLVKKEQEYIFFSGIKKNIWWKAREVKYHKAFTPMVNDLSGLHNTRCLNGRGTVIPVSIFKEIGGYDENKFPQYASDYDLTLRVQRHAYKCLISYDVKVYSFVEETGDGKSFVKQSGATFFKSFINPYSQTSLKMWYRYYKEHAPQTTFILGFLIQQLRTIYAFCKKRNLLSDIE
ncbi:glycosyltransferase family 2 protein [Labilibacter sediminis]|nr:glycosyltransferase family 2 protein [Labilibacter sediminis]